MAAPTAGRKGRPYRRARRIMFARWGDTCHLCGHTGATQADHDPPLDTLRRLGLDPNNPDYLRPAHGNTKRTRCTTCGRACNQERGMATGTPPPPHSRDW